MTSKFKIFFQIGGIVFLALFASLIAAHAKHWTDEIMVAEGLIHESQSVVSTSTTDKEVNDEDPTYVSGLSRVYTFTPGGTDLESEDNAWVIPAITGPLTAKEYIVIDLHSGAILLDKDIDKVAPIASLTKLVTAEVSRRLMPSDKKIAITPAMLAVYGVNGHFRHGETISAGDLLYPLLFVSSNSASEALAQGYESNAVTSRKDFIRAMNNWSIRSAPIIQTSTIRLGCLLLPYRRRATRRRSSSGSTGTIPVLSLSLTSAPRARAFTHGRTRLIS